MNDPQLLPLIAQNQEPGTPSHGEHVSDSAGTTESPFTRILSSLGDHHEITFGQAEILPLPFIVVDNGVHFYANEHALEGGGLFKLNATHHVVRVVDGKPPALDLSITSIICFQWAAMLILFAILIPMGRRYTKAALKPARGIFNAMEAVIIYVRDEIVLPGYNTHRFLKILIDKIRNQKYHALFLGYSQKIFQGAGRIGTAA